MAAFDKLIGLSIGILLMMGNTGCKQVELYERLQHIPGAAWRYNYQPVFTFNIKDTTSLYDIYITIRHTNSYAYSNIWLESSLQLPQDSMHTQKLNLILADNERWLGVGMDDIFMHRIKVTSRPQKLSRAGQITLSLKQVMRQDPLPGIMQVGVRVEKVNY